MTGTGRHRRILETTVAREAYFGYELTGEAALSFACANAPSSVEAVLTSGHSPARTALLAAMPDPA